jgi:predicted permease
MLDDLRFALRLLAKDKSFTITALLTLAVCVGANTAMFGIVRSVLMKPLPFSGSERMVLLYNSYPNAGAPRVGTAVPDYFDRQSAVPALDQQGIFRNEGMTFGDANGAERLSTFRATPSFFRMVGAQPIRGRLFTEDEGEPGKENKVLLSYGFWQRKFGGDGSAVSRQIRLNGATLEIVGVLPKDFNFLQNDIDLFTPAAFAPADKSDERRHSNNWQMVGRLKTGATIDLVRQQVEALNAHNDERFPELHQILKDARFHTVVVSLQDDVVRDVKASLYLLWGGVVLVLVIGCVNIANLVIVRSSGRSREMATRHAIGGDLGRLSRQLITETTVLSVIGGGLGILLGWWTLRSVSVLKLDNLPRGYEIGLDAMTVGVILVLTVVVGLLLGLAPAFRLRRMNLNVDLREETRGGTSSRRAHLLRSALATMQVAFALALLIGAGLLLASFRAVMRLDVGFQPQNVETAAISLPVDPYKETAAVVGFQERALAAIRALPDVQAAGLTSLVPFSGNVSNNVVLGEGHVMKPGESLLAPSTAFISSGYFEAMGVRLIGGRFLDDRDTATATKTAVIDDRLARLFWPGQDAVGRRLYQPTDRKDITKITPETQFITVVGVIKEMQLLDPRGDFTPVGTVFYPSAQNSVRGLALTVKTRAPSATIRSSLRQVIAQIDPQLPVYRPRSMEEWIDRALIGRRVPMLIAMAFGIVALFLAAIGIYGVLAYGVVQRRRELGVRMALGGTAMNIFSVVLSSGLKIIGVGIGAGLVLSYFVGQVVKSELFNVTPMNPVVLVLVTLALSVVALLASVVPAWRASKIDPIVVLSR